MTEAKFETRGNVVFLARRSGGKSVTYPAVVRTPSRVAVSPWRFPAWLVILVGMAVVLPATFLALTAMFVTWLALLCVLIGATVIPDLARRTMRSRSAGTTLMLIAPVASQAV